MPNIIVFVQTHGRQNILEAELAAEATFGELYDALAKVGLSADDDTFVFLDEAEDALRGERHERVPGIKHGSRIHVGRCHRIAVTVHYLNKIHEHPFAPGRRVRAVKEWAVRKFELSPKDAAEHVLQICKSTERPSSDTPLHQLVQGNECKLCFDLVPEKQVEG